MKVRKHYVDVLVYFQSDGKKIPKVIFWNKEKKFRIDRILDVRPAASRKVGGQGDRYLCLINGTEHVIYYEDPAWFVEEILQK